MSTRCSIKYAQDGETTIHLFTDCYVNQAVFLEITGPDVSFEASPGRIELRIPAHVWEFIRTAPSGYLEWMEDGKPVSAEPLKERIRALENQVKP